MQHAVRENSVKANNTLVDGLVNELENTMEIPVGEGKEPYKAE